MVEQRMTAGSGPAWAPGAGPRGAGSRSAEVPGAEQASHCGLATPGVHDRVPHPHTRRGASADLRSRRRWIPEDVSACTQRIHSGFLVDCLSGFDENSSAMVSGLLVIEKCVAVGLRSVET